MKLNREEGLGITLLTPTLRLPSALFYFLFTWRMKSPEGSGEVFIEFKGCIGIHQVLKG